MTDLTQNKTNSFLPYAQTEEVTEAGNPPFDEWLTTKQFCNLFDPPIAKRTAELWRQEGNGPLFSKLGQRIVYSRRNIDNWLKAREFDSTAASKAAGY